MTFKKICLFVTLALLNVSLLAEPLVSSSSNNASTANSGQSQGITYAPTSNVRSVTPTYGAPVSLGVPQNFLDPGMGANALADPLVWYYLDALATVCEEEPDLEVSEEEYVTISYQPDCGRNRGVDTNTQLGAVTARVDYMADFDEKAFYIPLGVISVQGNWSTAESVNLLTLLKSAQKYIRKNVKGFDKIILASDILRRTVATQRATEAASSGFSISPSLSSAFGRDGLVGSLVGYGSSDAIARPLNRKGATFVVAAVSPGPWLGARPKISQKQYFKQMIALPQELNTPIPQNNATKEMSAEELKIKATASR